MKKAVHMLFILAVVLSGFAAVIKISPSSMAQYTPHEPIQIEGDEDFAEQANYESWPGNGTEGNPYIIERYEINATTASGIEIEHTTVYFIIRDSRIIDGGRPNDGIYLRYVTNGVIENCTLENNSCGICLIRSNHNKILRNTFISNIYDDMRIELSRGNNISDNTMIGGGIFIPGEDLHYLNTHNIDTSNKINGKPVYYLKNRRSGLIPKGAGQVILVNCTNLLVENQDITNTYVGVFLAFSSNITIVNNTIQSNNIGISLYHSCHNHITQNIITNSSSTGIELEEDSNGNNITCNHCQNNFYGVLIFQSIGNNVIDNNVSNGWAGIGICWESRHNHIEYNTVNLNTAFGIDVSNANDNYIVNNNVFQNHCGIDISWYSKNNEFVGNNITNNNYGVSFDGWCSGNLIVNNKISNNNYSISSFNSNENEIANNSISNNEDGIYLYNSTDNIVINNSISSTEDYGIYLISSNKNTITNNAVFRNTNYGIIISSSCENSITDNTVSNNDYGVSLKNSSSGNDITNNNISENGDGIYISSCSGNTFTWNNILNNNWGLEIRNSSGNIFHHNSIDNEHQLNRWNSNNIWNDWNGEGNYWEDYTGIDSDGDGDGDTDLPHQGVDYYPLTDNRGSPLIEPLFLVLIVTALIVIAILLALLIFKRKLSKISLKEEQQEGAPPQKDQD